MKKDIFPWRSLNKTLARDSRADPQDVLDVKEFLQNAKFYKVPSYGLTPYPDEHLFEAIKNYQINKRLKVDGVMNIDGETQNQMRIDKEELAPPKKMIPGTNIPDEGIPEQGWPEGGLDSRRDKTNYNIDRSFDRTPPNDLMDPDFTIYPKDPSFPFLKTYKHKDL